MAQIIGTGKTKYKTRKVFFFIHSIRKENGVVVVDGSVAYFAKHLVVYSHDFYNTLILVNTLPMS